MSATHGPPGAAGRPDRPDRTPDAPPLPAAIAPMPVPEPPPGAEPDRFELREGPAYRFPVSRRDFLERFGGGILVLCMASELSALPAGPDLGHVFGGRPPAPDDIAQWLHIGSDGLVTVFTGKVEVGQDVRTSLAQAVADELRVPFEHVRMVMGDTDLTPFDMGTFGSQSTPRMSPQLRRAAAAAREALIRLAARRWGVDATALVARDGTVSDASGRRVLGYGELAAGERLTATIAADQATTPPAQWTVAGQSRTRPTARDIVSGRHRYPYDQALPEMLYGKVLRPPAFGATLTSLDTGAAEAMPGVVVVKDAPGPDGQPTFVGVAAPDAERAARALAGIRATWRRTPQPGATGIFAYLETHPAGGDNGPERRFRGGPRVVGDMAAGLRASAKTLEGRYTTAYIAHVPLEPRAALARWESGSRGRLTVWTGTQRPFGVRTELARAFGVPESRVRVIMPDTGSAYGGKHTGECAVEAARLARAAGRPVKLTWTREEEFTWAYFRPAALIEVHSGVAADGRLLAWEFHNYNAGSAGLQTPYVVPNQHVQYHPARSPLRQGSYRALAATANQFARETHMDELAQLVGVDPLEFRRRNLRDPRLLHVFEAAAQEAGWAGRGTGKGYGIAGGTEKGSYVATCARVSLGTGGAIRVERLVTAFDCGPVVNPANLRNQVEGAGIMGIGGALFESIDFADGRILNDRLSSYRVPRFHDVPELTTILVDRKDAPLAGAGETPIMAIAPAIGNAIHALTGRRLRSMPLLEG